MTDGNTLGVKKLFVSTNPTDPFCAVPKLYEKGISRSYLLIVNLHLYAAMFHINMYC